MIKRRHIKQRIVNVLVICLVGMTLNFFLKQRYLETTSNPTRETFVEIDLRTNNPSDKARNVKLNILKEKLPDLKTSAKSPKKPLTTSKCGYNVRFYNHSNVILILYINTVM